LGAPTPAGAHAELTLQIEEMTRQIALDPRNIDLYLRRGELHRTHLDWDSALADFNTVRTLEPANKYVDLAVGRLMADANWLLSARGFLDRFIAANPKHADAFTARARVHARLQLHLASADDYAAAIRFSPEPGPELFIERAQTLVAQSPEYCDKALEGLDEGIKQIGSLVTLQLLAIDLELKRTNYTGALARVDEIAQRSPRKEGWLTRRAEILEQAGQPQEARVAYRAALGALAALPPVRRNVPAMAQLEKRIRSHLEAIEGAPPPK
jgi:tetratricopeptide (TPR) repeat protein